jgi:hypothetical protein
MSTTLTTTKPAAVGKPAARPDYTDSELLALGAEFEIAWEAERRIDKSGCTDDELSAVYDLVSAIVDKISVLKATSLAGLRVKARTALWCQGDGTKPFNLGRLDAFDDMSISGSIVNDILAIGGRA